MSNYQHILGAIALGAVTVLVVAVVVFLIAVMTRAYRMSGATKPEDSPEAQDNRQREAS